MEPKNISPLQKKYSKIRFYQHIYVTAQIRRLKITNLIFSYHTHLLPINIFGQHKIAMTFPGHFPLVRQYLRTFPSVYSFLPSNSNFSITLFSLFLLRRKCTHTLPHTNITPFASFQKFK